VPELDAYLLISQKEQRVDIYQRDGRGWRFSTLTEGAFELQCPPIMLTVDGIYQGVTLANTEAAGAN
jgi:hypothetical protein